MSKNKKVELTNAEINHLRKLIGWVICEIGPSPEEHIDIVKKIAPAFKDGISEEGQVRLLESHHKYKSIPKYVRNAIKALEKTTSSAPIGDTGECPYCGTRYIGKSDD